jgi:phosphatidylglycerol lysyltransferase
VEVSSHDDAPESAPVPEEGAGAPDRVGLADRIGYRLKVLAPALPVLLLALAAWILHRELATFHYRDLRAEVRAVHVSHVLWALGLTAVNYLVLTLYDVLSLRSMGRSLPYRVVGPAAFVAYAFGANLGGSVLSSGGIRWRFYSLHGLSLGDLARLVATNAATFWMGLLAVSGVTLLAVTGSPILPLGRSGPVVGVALLALVALYVGAAAVIRRPLRIARWVFPLPTPRVAAAQVVLSAIDWSLAALVLWTLVPREAGISLAEVTAVFVAAQVAGLASHVPGGAGVFEAVALTALSPRLGAAGALGLLVLYRLVYYVVPFVTAALLLAAGELARRREWLARAGRTAMAAVAPIVPSAAAAGAFLAGTVLLVSGATPTLHARLRLLESALPLAVLEVSHFAGSVIGMALLLLAQALRRRLDGAWAITVGLLSAGAIASLAKGLDWEEATLLVGLLLALLPFRAQFRRRAAILEEPFASGWLLAAVLALAGSIWAGFFSYRHVEYRHDLWWEVAMRGDAPRFLRASVGAMVFAAALGVARLLRPAPPRIELATDAELAAIRPLVARSPESEAHLALLGDKAILTDPGGAGFLMFGVARRTFVAMGDPVGPEPVATDLAWQLRELADRHHGVACFYQVGADSLPRYLDMGLVLFKLGEEARVPLEHFNLEGGERRGLRQSVTRAERDGLSFEVVPREEVPALLPELRAISDAWMGGKATREKGFSLGFFSERYLCEGPLALARLRGRPVAFANLWAPAEKEELSLDLMRHLPDAPRGTMDFLFAKVMAWGSAQGYRRFSLGMAPFSGLPERALSPLWARLGARLFRHGEHFYNFRGVRQYKEKFHPEWAPRYLAAPGRLALPRVLAAIATLVNRGLGGLVTR